MAEIHIQAERDYMLGMKYKDIAEKHNVAINTVKSWKSRHGWQRKVKKGALKEVHTNKGCKQVQITPVIENEKLTEKQKLFCLFYVKNFNATQAAIKSGYSKNTAAEMGYENLTKPQIRDEVERIKNIKRQSIMLTEDDILERYMRIAFADMTDFTEFGTESIPDIDTETLKQKKDGNGKLVFWTRNYLNFKDHDQVDGGLICEIKTGKQGMSVKLQDQQKALEWLSNFFGMNMSHKHKWQYDNERLELERKKLTILENKDKAPDKPSVQPYIDALKGVMGDVWSDDAGE